MACVPLYSIWHDLDKDGKTDAGELKTLTESGITSFSLAQTSRFLARLIFGAFVLVWSSAASMADDTPATDREIMRIVVGETELSFPKTQYGFPVLVSYDMLGVPNSHRSFPFTIPPPEADILAKMVAEYYSKLTAS